MTLSDLAAMAVKHVEGFKRPVRNCQRCGGSGEEIGTSVGWRDDSEWAPPPRGKECRCLAATWAAGPYSEWDDSPAALAMAVLRCGVRSEVHFSLLFRKDRGRGDMIDVALRSDGSGNPIWMDMATADNPESIARALLVALLRAHGVEIPE